MAFEPNKKKFLAQLKLKDFDIANFVEKTDELQEIFWYLDARRAPEIVDDILNPALTKPEEIRQIVTNLAKLYPLSRAAVMEILHKARVPSYLDEDFLAGFDAAQELRKEIAAVFKAVESHIIRLTSKTNLYQNELNNLRADNERLQKTVQGMQSLREERDRVKAEVDRLREDTDRQTLQKRIDELEAEKNQLESEKHRQASEIDRRQKNIQEIKAELAELEKRLDPSEELSMLRELFRKFPADAEG